MNTDRIVSMMISDYDTNDGDKAKLVQDICDLFDTQMKVDYATPAEMRLEISELRDELLELTNVVIGLEKSIDEGKVQALPLGDDDIDYARSICGMSPTVKAAEEGKALDKVTGEASNIVLEAKENIPQEHTPLG